MYTFKKLLGQHFLKDENICKKIVAALRQHFFTQLLEVGPGGGAVTNYLLELPQTDFNAVELDYLLKTYPALQEKIIHRNFLDMERLFTGKFTVGGNFAYNIYTQLLFKILEWMDDVQCTVGMVQKEVAQQRKTLRNAVKNLIDAAIPEDDLFNKRAEQLTVQQFAELTFKMR